jgi:hypothetical protein
MAVSRHGLEERNMSEATRIKYLRTTLFLVGLVFIGGIYTFVVI